MAFFGNIERPALLPLVPFYGTGVFFRNLLFDVGLLKSTKFRIPVISVGNITVGGTGKTPHTEYLLTLLQNDYHVAVLSRGYKRDSKGFSIVKKKSRVSEVGDEPLQIRRKFPNCSVAVHNKRVEGIRLLEKTIRKLDVVILDDGFQHRYVKPGLSIVLIDYNRPVFNDILLPAGNLREPSGSLRRADIIVVTKCPAGISSHERRKFISKLKPSGHHDVFFSRYEYGQLTQVYKNKHEESSVLPFKRLRKKDISVILLTGIANSKPLKKFLSEYTQIDEELRFPDHHFFNDDDVESIREKFNALTTPEKYIIVTEKDAIRLQDVNIKDENLRRSIYYIPVEVKFLSKGEKPFIKRIYKYLKKAR